MSFDIGNPHRTLTIALSLVAQDLISFARVKVLEVPTSMVSVGRGGGAGGFGGGAGGFGGGAGGFGGGAGGFGGGAGGFGGGAGGFGGGAGGFGRGAGGRGGRGAGGRGGGRRGGIMWALRYHNGIEGRNIRVFQKVFLRISARRPDSWDQRWAS